MATLRAARRKKLPKTAFAVPGQRKLPLSDAAHVRNAAARLNQVKGISPAQRKTAARRIVAAARRVGVKTGPATLRRAGTR